MIFKRLTIITELVFFLTNNLCCSLNDTHAVILARGGSKGIKNKNLMHFDGKTLLERTIATIRNSGWFDNIWVSTDSHDIEKEALKNGALVYRRLPAFAQDRSSSLEAVKEFLYKNKFVQKFALFQCTSVFLKERYIIEAFDKFQRSTCVFAATRSHKLRWQMLDTHLILPLNFEPTKRPRRQDWEGEFVETGMFYFSTKELVNENSLQDTRCRIVEIDSADAIEIDDLNDLEMAKCMLHISRNVPTLLPKGYCD